MKVPVDTVRVSVKGREILIKLKRRTGLEHWNELCRIALCRSLAQPTAPLKATMAGGDSSIEMDWKTFAGILHHELMAALWLRAEADGVDFQSRDAIAQYFRAHLERGIGSLQNLHSIADLLGLADAA